MENCIFCKTGMRAADVHHAWQRALYLLVQNGDLEAGLAFSAVI